MFQIDEWMNQLREELLLTFGSKLVYIGLQGSYRRGEAKDNSDIDVMVVLDSLNVEDLYKYKNIISLMECSEKACGFICGVDELKNWPKHEIFLLTHETKDYYGRLGSFVPGFRNEDIKEFIKINVGNLYHEICHRFLYSTAEKNYNNLKFSFKTTFYILQNLYYLNTGEFISNKTDLLKKLKGKDKEILETAILLSDDNHVDRIDFDKYFNLLFEWCKNLLQTM